METPRNKYPTAPWRNLQLLCIHVGKISNHTWGTAMLLLSALRMIQLEIRTNWSKDHESEACDKEKITNQIN